MYPPSFYEASSSSISAPQKVKLLRTLTNIEFSGKIIWQDSLANRWICLYDRGRLLYATGGKHLTRRWRRHLQQQCLSPQATSILLNLALSNESNLDLLDHQEYAQTSALVKTGELTSDQATGIIKPIVEEVLFDILLAEDATYKIIKSEVSLPEGSPISIDQESLLEKTLKLWESWEKSNLNNYSPDQAPVIRNTEKIREKTNKQLYQVLTTLLNGRNTLRDVALKTNRDVVQITQALKTFIQLGWIDLLDIPDYSPPIDAIEAKMAASEPKKNWALIACVDDSPMVCQTMENIVRAQGYQYISVLDAQRALATLLAKRPDIIFLDLVMPYTNGYEICSQLRKVSRFSDIPIIILSGNDGVVDQVRARLMGATDFVSKPVEPTTILSKIEQYLDSPEPIYQ